MYRMRADMPEVLLVHPGGPFWARRDQGAWSIPKGEIEADEVPLRAAQREFTEETGASAAGPFHALTPVRQRSGKWVQAWVAAGELDAAAVRSNSFAMEWPPHSGHTQSFPEIDRAAWFPLAQAHLQIVPGQRPLLDELALLLARLPAAPGDSRA
jgi:predicted NUDIX family NTP pyrophosphohydrolase